MNKKLGYYRVANKFDIESKIQACIVATEIARLNPGVDPKSLVSWKFNDDIFDAYRWDIEPAESLDELYDRRARQLREQYDYISISYSAGADSHNIVSAFLRQGLHIDELVVKTVDAARKYSKLIDPKNDRCMDTYTNERVLQMEPRLREIQIASPNTKIKYYDASEQVVSGFRNVKDESWVLGVREELNPVDAMRYNYMKLPDFQPNLDKGKKVGIILGIDKPRLEIDYQTLDVSIMLYDRVANAIPVGQYMKEYTNTTIEYFYWAPEAIDILCKQVHTIKKWLESNQQLHKFFYTNVNVAYRDMTPVRVWRQVNERLIRLVVYPTTWKDDWFQSEKAVYDWYAEHDAWFFNGMKNTPEHEAWKKGLQYVVEKARPFVNARGDVLDGLHTFKKLYKIGKLNNAHRFILE